MDELRCCSCNRAKPLQAFSLGGHSPSGRPTCNSCMPLVNKRTHDRKFISQKKSYRKATTKKFNENPDRQIDIILRNIKDE